MIVTGKALPLLIDNVDTDQIIAAEHLKTLTRTGLGKHAFAALRGSNRVLVDPAYAAAPILIAGRNFGCGSSREHAVWAILDMGISAVIAESFSDIFAGNACKKGLLTVALPPRASAELARGAESDEVSIDLANQHVRCGELSFDFHIDPFRRECLLTGLDEIDLTLRHQQAIAAYEGRSWIAGLLPPADSTPARESVPLSRK